MRFENYDDKLLFDNIVRYEHFDKYINSIIKKNRKRRLIASIVLFAFSLLFLSIRIMGFNDFDDFLKNHLSFSDFMSVFNLFYPIFFISALFFTLFLISYSSFEFNIKKKHVCKKIYFVLKKHDIDDYVSLNEIELDFDTTNYYVINSLISKKFFIDHEILVDDNKKEFIIKVCDNFITKPFNFSDLKDIRINIDGINFNSVNADEFKTFFMVDKFQKNINYCALILTVKDKSIPLVLIYNKSDNKKLKYYTELKGEINKLYSFLKSLN